MRQGQGFTLIELVITLAITSLIFASVIPSFERLIEQQHLKSSAYDFYRELGFARTEANYRRARVAITYRQNDWAAGWQVFQDDNQNGKYDEGERLLHEHAALHAQAKVHEGKTVRGYIGYNANGNSVHPNNAFLADTITFCSSSSRIQSLRITVSITGRARISTTDNTTAPCNG